MKQAPCNNCGDCYTGCNYGEKNTFYMNYLPMARLEWDARIPIRPNLSLLNQANPQVFDAEFRAGRGMYRLRGGLDIGSAAAPEPFLALQNYLGSSGEDLELRFVLTRE